MGWDFVKDATRQDIIADRVKPWYGLDRAYHEPLAHSTSGNVLWSVWRTIPAEGVKPWLIIRCTLLSAHKGYGWGYKDMSEEMHPYYYTCPLAYLDMVAPETPNPFNLEWRELVRQYWQERQRKRAIAVTVGQVVKLQGSTISEVTIESVRPLLGRYNGKLYRIPRKFLEG